MFDPHAIGGHYGVDGDDGGADSDSRPRSREKLPATKLWIDRKPSDFLRAMRKSATDPLLLGAGLGGAYTEARRKGVSAPHAKPRPFKRRARSTRR